MGNRPHSLADFLRHILGLSSATVVEERINEAFDQFIADHGYLRASQFNYPTGCKSCGTYDGRDSLGGSRGTALLARRQHRHPL